MSISNLLTAIWSALRGTTGGGQDFVVVYTALGAVLWGFLLFKVFLQEGLQVATGHRSELVRILVKYLFIAGMFAIWPQASSSIFSAVKLLATTFYPSLDSLLDKMAGSMGFMEGSRQTAAALAGPAVRPTLFGFLSIPQVRAQVTGPLMSVFPPNKIVNALVGGGAGSGLGSRPLGVAGIGLSLPPGGAMVRSPAAAG